MNAWAEGIIMGSTDTLQWPLSAAVISTPPSALCLRMVEAASCGSERVWMARESHAVVNHCDLPNSPEHCGEPGFF